VNVDSLADVPALDPSFSLTHALRHVALCGGRELDVDDLHAALGLSFMTVAVPSLERVSLWPLAARDAFLVEAAQLFGMTVREVHPPEAARGLDGAEEFAQHFDASYRPLIETALAHGQPVLAWAGWTGAAERLWGLVNGPGEGPIGFAGTIIGADGAVNGHHVPFSRPPMQLYVVETVSARTAAPDELLRCAIAHAGAALGNRLSERFAVVTGPEAFDAWAARIACPSERQAGPCSEAVEHGRLAGSVIAAHRSGLRFLQRWTEACGDGRRDLLQALARGCQDLVGALGGCTDLPNDRAKRSWTRQLASAIADAQSTSCRMLAALDAHLRAGP